MTTYSTMEMPPMARVDVVGVRKRRWILAKEAGMALNTAIDSVVRAVGRIVVWVEAAAELEHHEHEQLGEEAAEPRSAEDG